MTLYRLFICTILCCALLQAKAQDSTDKEKPEYKFDSTLKGGYSLYYTTDDSMQYLYLRKGDKLKLISADDIGNRNRQSMLGFVGADFDDYFVLVHPLQINARQEYPITCELFEKRTMNVIIKTDFITWEGDYLLLHNSRVMNDSMRLYNVKTKKTEYFPFPKETGGDNRLVNAIEIKTIKPRSLTVTYYITPYFDVEKQKTYKRK